MRKDCEGASGGGGGGLMGATVGEGFDSTGPLRHERSAWVWIRGNVVWGCFGDMGVNLYEPSFTTKVRSLHNSFCKSNSWRLVSRKALRALNARGALPVHTVFEGRKYNGSAEKPVKLKIA